MLQASGIVKQYGSLKVLQNIDLTVNTGEIVSLVGSSGAGKTTLVHILGTLDQPDAGELSLHGKRYDQLRGKSLSSFRNQHIGFVFQFHHLLPEFSAIENICIPGWIAGVPKKEVEHKAMELLDRLGIASRADHKPGALSGGEQQRVAVARALINGADVIFADEPTGNLDSENANSLHLLFKTLRDEFNQTFVIVTHNKELAAMSDRVLELKDGSWL